MAERNGRRGRIAFVPPRYGTDVVGGSEAVSREAAHGLAERGWDVEILTTCARDHYTWRNEYEPGASTINGVTVRRFPVVKPRSTAVRDRIEQRIQLEQPVTIEQQMRWANGLFRVPDLFQHLVTHGREYRAIVFSPYLFWTTIVCSAVAPERSIVMPCLHDETYAHLELFQPVLGNPAAVWFLSEPEHQLGHRLGQLPVRHTVTGAGIPVPESYDPAGFRERHGLTRPFIFYAGRREFGKGWNWLLHAFAGALSRHRLPFDLVTMGVGPVNAPAAIADRVIDLGFLTIEEAGNAFAAAEAYVQPSRNESFSRTIMEAWLAGTPVIANVESDVVAWHCERAEAGLTYHDEFEFGQALLFVADAPKAAAQIAARGRDYVLESYTWPSVLDRMEQSLESFPQ